jgi:regulator of protease activity HflC (stomatin/prohibitin superfamily)
MIAELCGLSIFLIVITLWATIVQVEQYESGVALRLGKFHEMFNPGWNFVIPLVTAVVRVDLRIQPLEIPNHVYITKDRSRTTIGAVVYYRVEDAKKAVLNVADYKAAIVDMAQTTLRGVVGDMQLDEIFSNLDEVNSTICDKLNVETDSWGVKVDTVEIRKHNPLVERERRAAFLKAEVS